MSHFLKRLELNGFKSFAGKTVLEFPAGIVAVVGPNGSGKSNIVDSLRWLLGERDAKNLRGGKVEDLIFAGTQKRARVGLASASLYFENRNKFFPVDFEEVVITRQVSRGGESKYFLNKSEVLLRDLVDFFAKARLGSRGLIIIGQGDSDLFIRSSPMERREMIEEILGLREYQLKKADAERRLKNSRINLDKTKALVEEILPHLRSLKRQTNRWERRGALEDELRGLETQYFGFQLKELGEKTRAAEEKIKTSEHEYEEFVKALRAAEVRQAEIEASQPKEKQGMAAIKDEIQGLLEKRSTLQKDLGRLEAQIELAEKMSATDTAEVAASTAGGHSAEHLLNLVNTIKEELARALEEDAMELHATVENILEEINDVLRESKGKKSSGVPEEGPGSSRGAGGGGGGAGAGANFKPQFEKLSRDLAALDAQVVSLREKERSFEESQEGFYRTFKAAVEAVQVAKNKIGDWENRNREHQLAKERLDLRREEIVRQIEQAGRTPKDFEGAAAHAAIPTEMRETDLAEMERRLFRLRGELASMGEVDQALMKEAQDTEARYAFLTKESEDLERAVADLTRLMVDLSEKIKKEFDGSLHKINEEFSKFFALMFGGGTARLRVEKPRVEKAADDEAREA
ncbi:MAG TPA: AAA family ATPase, partial [Candidatus Paceibacterota bacterium]|nr:AAA family ATPase [Candidatus Paceibacterota bacterium]